MTAAEEVCVALAAAATRQQLQTGPLIEYRKCRPDQVCRRPKTQTLMAYAPSLVTDGNAHGGLTIDRQCTWRDAFATSGRCALNGEAKLRKVLQLP